MPAGDLVFFDTGHDLQLQSLSRTPTAAVSQHMFGPTALYHGVCHAEDPMANGACNQSTISALPPSGRPLVRWGRRAVEGGNAMVPADHSLCSKYGLYSNTMALITCLRAVERERRGEERRGTRSSRRGFGAGGLWRRAKLWCLRIIVHAANVDCIPTQWA